MDKKLEEVNDMHKTVRRETKEATNEAVSTKNLAFAAKSVSTAAGVSGAAVTVTSGFLLAGGALLSGGILLPAGASIAVLGYMFRGLFKEKEEKSKHMSLDLEKLHEAVDSLDSITDLVKRKRNLIRLDKEIKLVHRPHPLLTGLTSSFETIFDLLKGINLEEERRRANDLKPK